MQTIFPAHAKVERFTPERCFITELCNDPADAACSIARARVEPGVTTQLHSLTGVTERYVILQGDGRMEVGGRIMGNVSPGDVIHIPAGVSQRITNVGGADLVFLCVCTPRFTPECYKNLEGV